MHVNGVLIVIIALMFLLLMIKFPVFIIGLVLAYWGVTSMKKLKRQKKTSKLAHALLAIGLLLALTGCVSSFSDDESKEPTSSPIEKEDAHKESAIVDKQSEKDDKLTNGVPPVATETDKSKSDHNATTVDGQDKNGTVGQQNPVKKTETAGTTAQVPVKLVKTIDGDTIKVLYNGEERNVRYLLIDTPETNHPRLGKQPFGEEAKERNRELVNSGALTLEFDVGERFDKYDRLLAYVYVDGKSVQETLLAEGLARVAYVYPPNTRHLTPFEEVQTVAKQKGIGIWSVENYATDSGFDSDVIPTKPATGSGGASSQPVTPPKTNATAPHSNMADGQEWFKNCTELRVKYPNGVPEGHAAYQSKMDRDKDGYACER